MIAIKAGEAYKYPSPVVGTVGPILLHSDGACDLSIVPLLGVRANNL